MLIWYTASIKDIMVWLCKIIIVVFRDAELKKLSFLLSILNEPLIMPSNLINNFICFFLNSIDT